MRTPPSYFITAFLAVLTFHCVAADPSNAPPTIVVIQYADYPAPGRGSSYPDGLIAAMWSDGRMIRPSGSNSVGKSYVEGTVSAADRDTFFAFLSKSSAFGNQESDGEGIPLHAAYQHVTLYRNGKKSKWIRPLPDRKAGLYELEERLRGLPIQGQRPVDWQAVRRSGWYK